MNLRKHLAVLAALAMSVSVTACGSSDDDDGAGGGSGSGSGLGGLLGKLGGNNSGNNSGNDTGGGEAGGGASGGGDTGGGDTGGGDTGGGNTGGGEGINCMTACGLVLNCLNQACGTDFTQNDCQAECEGNNETLPLSADTGCDTLATALEIGSFQAVCGEVSGGGGDTGGGDTGGGDTGGGGGGDGSLCCNAIGCVAECGQDQGCLQGCITDICGQDGSACAQCDAWAEANQQTAAECAGYTGDVSGGASGGEF